MDNRDDQLFFAYPSHPEQLRATIETAVEFLGRSGSRHYATWRDLDIPGRFILDGVLEKIEQSQYVVADITRLNFNVTFEIGYALGKGRRVILIVNSTLQPELKELSRLGLFDSLGHILYENSAGLQTLLKAVDDHQPTRFPQVSIDRAAPIFVVEPGLKTDAVIRTNAKIKKSRIRYRSFDPSEQPRMSALDAYKGVSASVAVVVHLLSSETTDFRLNNLRGAFVAGLAFGLGRKTLILQEGEDPVPLDYRDLVSVYHQPRDIDSYINELAPEVMEAMQSAPVAGVAGVSNLLERLELGASSAENEITRLGTYYLPTDQFNRTLSGDARLVVGRKGSGKTALFFQVRDKVRTGRKFIVLDLKPEGHQLKRLKEMVLSFLGEAIQEHIASAFWEYALLLELCHRILNDDRELHLRDHEIYQPYLALAQAYHQDTLIREGDFSERMMELVQRISDDFSASKDSPRDGQLGAKEVVSLIYKHDMVKLRSELTSYLRNKEGTWILFDNIDKGWPTRGVEPPDIVILRALLDATRDIERLFARAKVEAHTVVFLRNDVYELLVSETPDRGKETRVSLDWTDPDLLKEMVRRRLVANEGIDRKTEFDAIWRKVCVSHLDGEETADYLVERSLMRPRNLLNLIGHCKCIAVNLGHQRIEVGDIHKAMKQYSADIGEELCLEIRDVFPEADSILYYFIGCPSRLGMKDLLAVLSETPVPADKHLVLIEILLWFCFIGVVANSGAEEREYFAYDLFYDMRKLKHLAGNLSRSDVQFVVHRAFWPFLDIQPHA